MTRDDAPRIDRVRPDGPGIASSRRAVVVTLAMAGFVAIAILKPWTEPGVPRVSIAPVATPAAALTRSATPTQGLRRADPGPAPKLAVFRPSVEAIWGALRRHPEPGIRVVVPATTPSDGQVSGTTPLEERWTPLSVAPQPQDRDPRRPGGTGVLEVETDGRDVVALGLTGPELDVPLDTRIWRVVPGQVPELVVPQEVPADPGRPLWFARDGAGSSLASWRAGVYRIDMLAAGAITRLLIRIPGVAPAPGPASDAPAIAGDEARLARARLGTAEQTGLALIVGTDAIALPRAADSAWDELMSWTDPIDRSLDRTRATRVLAGAATTLAWLREPGTEVASTLVTMLAPTRQRFALATEPITLVRDGRAYPMLLLRQASGSPWAAGVYRIEASWTDVDGDLRLEAWHLDLAPVGELDPRGTLVGRAKAAAAEVTPAGTRLPVLGDVDRFDGGAIARPLDACADRALLEPDVVALGVEPLEQAAVEELHVARLFEDAIRVRVTAGLVRPDADGLGFVMPALGRWDPGAYRINVRYAEPDARGLRSETFLACIGVREGRRLGFAPDSTLFVRP